MERYLKIGLNDNLELSIEAVGMTKIQAMIIAECVVDSVKMELDDDELKRWQQAEEFGREQYQKTLKETVKERINGKQESI